MRDQLGEPLGVAHDQLVGLAQDFAALARLLRGPALERAPARRRPRPWRRRRWRWRPRRSCSRSPDRSRRSGAPSEDLLHLPPIQRSVGTLASRLSYMAIAHSLVIASVHAPMTNVHEAAPSVIAGQRPATRIQLAQRPPHRSTMRSTSAGSMSSRMSAAGSGHVRRGDAHQRAVEIVERLVGDDRDDLGAPAAQPRVLLDREQPVGLARPSRGWSGCRAAPASARRSPRSRCRARRSSFSAAAERARHHQRQRQDGGVLARAQRSWRCRACRRSRRPAPRPWSA